MIWLTVKHRVLHLKEAHVVPLWARPIRAACHGIEWLLTW